MAWQRARQRQVGGIPFRSPDGLGGRCPCLGRRRPKRRAVRPSFELRNFDRPRGKCNDLALFRSLDDKQLAEMQMVIRGLIFDFDGVIADSEALANTVLAESVSSLGQQTTLDEALSRYMGKRWPEVVALIETDIGRTVPDGFSDTLKAATLERFRAELREVQGAAAFIRYFAHLPRCIASSSSLDRLQICLDVLGLAGEFGTNVFSAEMVERGKPHPEIFLLAAQRMGIAPANCMVIEDSANGVRAALAAGMAVIGLCAGSHLRPGHSQRLIDAGASYIAQTWNEVLVIVTSLVECQGASVRTVC